MIVPGKKDALFSFIFLDDLVNCIIKTIEDNNIPIKEKYYVCENKIYQWSEFIEKMAEKMKVKKPLMINANPKILYLTGFIYELFSFIGNFEPVFNRDKAREANNAYWTCSPKKWEKITNFKEWTSLEEGLTITFKEEK